MTHLIVHYHLRPGGVTSVILAEIASLHSQGKTVVLVSGSDAKDLVVLHHFLPELDYANKTDVSSEQLFSRLMELARLYPGPIVWHIHNPFLGCHPIFTDCVKRLAQANERMIFHLHDFAEDGRPNNYAQLIHKEKLYPRAAQIHYLVLTRRDAQILEGAGLPSHSCTVLPNPVTAEAVAMDRNATQVLYPTRGIDRKNLGEFLLLAALAPEGVTFATSLGPGTSRSQQSYAFWQQCAEEMALPVTLAKAELYSLSREQLLAESSHLVTTSVKEGFGLAFLESIAWDRPLFGRALPHVRADLLEYGIEHPDLYDRIGVSDGDFASLDLWAKRRAIEQARHDPSQVWIEQAGEKMPARTWLRSVLTKRGSTLDRSCLAPFSATAHAEKLAAIAAHLAAVHPGNIDFLDASVVKRAFDG